MIQIQIRNRQWPGYDPDQYKNAIKWEDFWTGTTWNSTYRC